MNENLHRYVIVGVSIPAHDVDLPSVEWLPYPLTHYSLERGQAEIDELNGQLEDVDDHGYIHPFKEYKLIPVSDELVGQWDETIASRTA
jgi:hypothetical protein